jgi:hypothetical protein
MVGQENPNNTEQLARFSMTQSLGRFSFLWLITFGVYGLHWHYMNWRSFGYTKLSSVGFAIFNEFSIYGLSKRIFRLVNGQGITVGIEPVVFLFSCVLGSIIGNTAPGFWFLLGMPLILLPTLYLQRFLNMYWLQSNPGHAQRSLFSGGFIAWSIVGSILWFLIILSTLDEMGVVKLDG